MNLLQLITPINLAEEEERFFASATYHPQFRYEWDKDLIDQWLQKAPRYRYLVSAIIIQDYNQITFEAERLFFVPWTMNLLNLARREVLVCPLPKLVSVQEIQSVYTNIIKKFNLDYQVEIVDLNGFVGRPQPSKKRIIISSFAKPYFFTLEGSARHEFTHIFRYENGVYNGIKRSANYLPTEEGLASYTQDNWSGKVGPSKFQHAAEYAVTEVMRQGTLRDGVEYLISIGFPPKLAWQRASRHKFGFIDTTKPGDIMKPAMYFAYSQKISELSEDERIRLFVGKISIEELSHYPEYTGRWSKEEIRTFFFNDL